MIFAHVLAAALFAVQSTPAPPATPAPSASPATPGVITVDPAGVALNPAQQQVIAVTGAVAPLTATLDAKLVLVAVDPSATRVTVTATQATGSDVLHLTDATGARADVPIRVAFNAGTIVPQATLKITGNPIDPAWLGRLATAWVQRLTQAQPGAQIAVGNPAPPPPALAPGAQTQLSVPVQISSGDDRYFPQSGATQLDVANVPADPFAPVLLFYDDDPEHVAQDGVLFRGTVRAGEPAGLYYYHDNAGDPRRIVVALSSDSQDPTQVQVIDASAGPNIDVMQVGHSVSRTFLEVEPRGEGTIVDLSPGQPFVLHDVAMSARQGVAGKVNLRVLQGGPVIATVMAVSPGVDPVALLGQAQLPGDGHHRTGVFRVAGFGTNTLTYAAGSPDVTLAIGDTDPTPPNADPSAPGHDYGDYGVLHTIDLNLSNPTPGAAIAYLYLRPIAGVDRASFLVDGTLVQVGCVRRPIPYQISAFSLAPGQNARAVVQTMTDGGSFFPVEIGVTATPPQPAAPPIDASDGCFPKP